MCVPTECSYYCVNRFAVEVLLVLIQTFCPLQEGKEVLEVCCNFISYITHSHRSARVL